MEQMDRAPCNADGSPAKPGGRMLRTGRTLRRRISEIFTAGFASGSDSGRGSTNALGGSRGVTEEKFVGGETEGEREEDEQPPSPLPPPPPQREDSMWR